MRHFERLRRSRGRQAVRMALLAASSLLVLVGCGDEDDNAGDQAVLTQAAGPRTNVQVSPASNQRVEQGVEGELITIENGGFDVETVTGQVQEPNVLTIVNQDDAAYRFGIENLLQPVSIAAGEETRVEFTTPTAGQFEGQLYPAEGDDVIATIQFEVQEPGGL